MNAPYINVETGHTIRDFDMLRSLLSATDAIAAAQETADANGAPVGVWDRDGWYCVCEVPPDEIEPSPESNGWHIFALVDPN